MMLPGGTKYGRVKQMVTLFCILFSVMSGSDGTITMFQGSSTKFQKHSGCGTTKTCFSDCSDSAGCTYEVACSGDGTNAECTLTATVSPGNAYILMAFSSDDKMGADSVTGCTYINSQASLYNGKNVGKTPTPLANTGVTLTANQYLNNILQCTFTREMAEGLSGDRFDLSQPWYWLFAKGTTDGQGVLSYHTFANRYASAEKYDLSTGPVTQSPNTQSTQAPTSLPAAGTLVRDNACGTTKYCFSDCSGQADCTFEIACSVSGADATCSLKGIVATGDNAYIAWGLSDNQKMGNDSVIGCKVVNGAVQIYNAENQARSSTEENPPDSGITMTSNSFTDRVLQCTFTRLMSPTTGSKLFDLNTDFYWLFATGPLAGTAPTYHGPEGKKASSGKLDMTSSSFVNLGPGAPVTDPPASTSGSLSKDSDCGSSKGCYSRCASATSCTFTVSWSKDSDGLTAVYTLVSDIGSSSGKYIALGFSEDGNMGNDDVIGCVGLTDGTVAKFSAVNQGKSPEIYQDNSVELVSGSLTDGALRCAIRRKVAPYTVASYTRKDIDQPLFLLVARGSGSVDGNGKVGIEFHGTNNMFSSDVATTAASTDDLTAELEDYPMIKVHGALMIGAWVFLASIGIVAARYFKSVWSVELFSSKVWFQIHRTSMILVFCCCVAGFVVIFVEVEEWVDIHESPSYVEYHPIMGVIVTGLCVINPLMALIRPHPGTKYRPIFNWAHWFVGTAAHALGVVTIFFGFELDKSDAPSYLKYILAGYVAWQLLIELILEFMNCCCTVKDRRDVYELSANGQPSSSQGNKTQPEQVNSARKVIFVLHFLVVTSISAVLIGLLAVGKRELDD